MFCYHLTPIHSNGIGEAALQGGLLSEEQTISIREADARLQAALEEARAASKASQSVRDMEVVVCLDSNHWR